MKITKKLPLIFISVSQELNLKLIKSTNKSEDKILDILMQSFESSNDI